LEKTGAADEAQKERAIASEIERASNAKGGKE